MLEDAHHLIAELLISHDGAIHGAQQLMIARETADELILSVESAIDEAIGQRDDKAIDRAVSLALAAEAARADEQRALEQWVRHLERIDELRSAASRLVARLP